MVSFGSQNAVVVCLQVGHYQEKRALTLAKITVQHSHSGHTKFAPSTARVEHTLSESDHNFVEEKMSHCDRIDI
jgi:hypothetical protein